MPIEIPSLSRRKFIAGSVTAGATCVLAPGLLAAEKKPVDKDLWVFFSDTHIAADRRVVHLGANMSVNFATAAWEVRELPERPAGMIISGDCALETGERGDYGTLTELLAPLRQTGMPIHALVGNHDDRENFWDALKGSKERRRPMKDRQAALLKTPRVNWLLLDTMQKTNVTPGLLGATQLEWLKTTLDANSGKPAIIVAHHHLTGYGDPANALQDTNDLLAIIRPRKQVKAYIYGHTHEWGIHRDETGIHLVNLPPTAFLFSPGPPNGWVTAQLESSGIIFQIHCLDQTHKEHLRAVELTYRAG